MNHDEQQLALLERDIDVVRDRIALDRRLLTEQLAPVGGGVDLVDELLTQCDEFGTPHVRSQLARSPHAYNLGALQPIPLATVGQLLERLTYAGYDFDNLIVARESLLTAADPNHRRVFPWFGREFVLDETGRTLRFAHTPDASEPAQLTAVANSAAPSVGPDSGPSTTRRHRRDRDR